MLALGRLGEAERSIASLRALGEPENSQVLQSAMLRLRMAQGDLAQAGALARRLPDAKDALQDSLVLAAVQSALKNQDLSTAKAWLDRSTAAKGESMLRKLSRALLARADQHADTALQLAREANAMSERDGIPDDRIRAGVLLARVLLEQGQTDRASAVLGDLDTFSSSDYRVAWTTLTLYRALGDKGMAANALTRVEALRGERDPAVEPAL